MRTTYPAEISFLGRKKTKLQQKGKRKEKEKSPTTSSTTWRKTIKYKHNVKNTHFRLLFSKSPNQRFPNVNSLSSNKKNGWFFIQIVNVFSPTVLSLTGSLSPFRRCPMATVSTGFEIQSRRDHFSRTYDFERLLSSFSFSLSHSFHRKHTKL